MQNSINLEDKIWIQPIRRPVSSFIFNFFFEVDLLITQEARYFWKLTYWLLKKLDIFENLHISYLVIKKLVEKKLVIEYLIHL